MDKQFLNIFQKIGTNDLSKNDFILSCFEEVMSPHWPQPQSEYHCRICNYEEFATEEALDTHITSAHHVILEKSYSLSFCLACQLHCVDAKGIAEHRKQPKHKLLDKLFQDLKSEALTYWKEQQQQQFHNVEIENVQKITSVCSIKIKQNDTIDNQPTKSLHVCKKESKSSRINPKSKFKNTTTERTGKELQIEKANVKKPVPAIVSMINQQIKGNNKQAKPEQLLAKPEQLLAKLEVQKEKAKKLVPKVVAVVNQQIKESDKLVKSEIQKIEAKKSVLKVVSAIDKQSKEKKPGKPENIKDKVEKTVPNVVSTISQQIKKTSKTSKMSSAPKSVEAQTQRKTKQKSRMNLIF
ncbi:triadin-like isoform X2 [Hydractinia symbiolongicarpus]|uniref:triadin-like isoform X2 n=1 Tax=Hydractinia symbiolongicarpus TaxID=13093 RepID=UPI002551160C|nr:triadin-like isoform X2 [Hydractinia symbiolongicarpus]